MLPNNFLGTLSYNRCDDWLIFAHDVTGQQWYVNTEMWPEWLDIPEEEIDKAHEQGDNPVEKFMLPIARERWLDLNWYMV